MALTWVATLRTVSSTWPRVVCVHLFGAVDRYPRVMGSARPSGWFVLFGGVEASFAECLCQLPAELIAFCAEFADLFVGGFQTA